MSKPQLILLEFNELCPALMDRFIAAGHLPNFKRLRDQSNTFLTDAEECNDTLEPWIQWVTVHTGLSYEEHGVFNLGDSHKQVAPSVWDLLSQEDHSVWVCGSMNAKHSLPINGLVLPDAWSTPDSACSPELQLLCDFIRRHVQEHSNEAARFAKSDYLKVLWFLIRHGLSWATISSIASQLLNEATGRHAWKRAVILDKLLWDVFEHFHALRKPGFSTFFSNSVAHFQHKYWRNMEPELFAVKPSSEEQADYQDAILFAYQETDKLVGRALSMASPDTAIVFATALSQQPYLAAEGEGGKHFYRPREFDRFLAAAKLKGVQEIAPVMSEEFHVYFESEDAAEQGMNDLLALKVNGEPLMKARREGSDVFTGCQIFGAIEPGAMFETGADRCDFFQLFYQADSIKSGMHHPDGMLWVRPAQGRTPENAGGAKVPLRAITPAILSYFGVGPSPEMPVQSEGLNLG